MSSSDKASSNVELHSRAKSPGKPRPVSPARTRSPMKARLTAAIDSLPNITPNLLAHAPKFKSFVEIEEETTASPYFGNLADRFSDVERTFFDNIAYQIENAISANDSVKFYVLLFIAAVFCVVFVFLWRHVSEGDKAHDYDLAGIFFMIIQVLLSSGYDGSIIRQDERLVFICIAVIG
jgi:hypothetical protein